MWLLLLPRDVLALLVALSSLRSRVNLQRTCRTLRDVSLTKGIWVESYDALFVRHSCVHLLSSATDWMSAYVSHFLRHSRIEQIGHKIAHYLRRSTSFPPYEQGRWTSLSNGTFSRHTTPDADLLSALGYTSFADTYDMGDESEFSVLVTVETPHPPEDVFDAALDVASWGTWDHAVAAADVVHAIAPMRFSDGSKGALDVIRIHYPPGPYVCLRVHARCPDGSFFVGHVSDPEGVLAAYFGLRRRDVGAADAFDLLGLDPDRMWLILPTGFHITPMGGGGCRLTHVLHLNTRELCPPQLVQHFVRIKSLTLKKFIDEVESRKTARKEIKARLERRLLGGVGEVDSMYGVPQGKDVYRHYLGGGLSQPPTMLVRPLLDKRRVFI